MNVIINQDGSATEMAHPWEFRDEPNWLATLPTGRNTEAVAKRIRDLVVENERLRQLVAHGAGMTAEVPEMGHDVFAADCEREIRKWGKR